MCLADIIWYVLSVPGGAFSRQYGTYWLFLGVRLVDMIWYILSVSGGALTTVRLVCSWQCV